MRSEFATAIAVIGFLSTSQTFAWSENGHQTVGTITDILIQGSSAEAQVKSVLGTVNGQQLALQQVGPIVLAASSQAIPIC